MGVVNLQVERARRRPASVPDRLMVAAGILHQIRLESDGVLFVDAEDLTRRLGVVVATLIEASAELAEGRRTS